jgi:hypothetical protein
MTEEAKSAGQSMTAPTCARCRSKPGEKYWGVQREGNVSTWTVITDTCRCYRLYLDELNPLYESLLPKEVRTSQPEQPLPWNVSNVGSEYVQPGTFPYEHLAVLPEERTKKKKKRWTKEEKRLRKFKLASYSD